MKTFCPPGCHHNGFVATHGHTMATNAIVVITGGGAHYFHDNIYILRSSCFLEI